MGLVTGTGMGKRKRKLTPAEKAAKKKRRQEYKTIFINGKMKRVRRPTTIEGMTVDEFIRQNADPVFLHQEELWEYLIDGSEVDIESSARTYLLDLSAVDPAEIAGAGKALERMHRHGRFQLVLR